MRNKRERKQMPLFYIHQPNIDMPEPKMQRNYLIKDEDLVALNVENAQKENPTSEKPPENSAKEENQKEVNAETEPLQENKKRPFNDLTLDEKIKHLKLVPASIAKVRYEFITVDQSYIGYFLDIKNGALVILSTSPRKKNVSIIASDLVDIKRVGL